MADYGREWSRRPGQRLHRGARGREEFGYGGHQGAGRGEYPRRRAQRRIGAFGREPGIEEGFGYGMETGYGVEMQRGPERGYRTQRGYQPTPGYETERGYRGGEYGVWTDYGERHLPEYGYDFEFGGRGRPPQRYYRGGRQGRAESTRFGPSGFRRAREQAPLPREGHLYGREFARHGYGRRFPGQHFRAGTSRYPEEYLDEGRFAREEFGPGERQGAHPRYGRTPVDRWPSAGHDVDHLDRDTLELDDGEIREAVLENLFQDSWIDPERIDIDVDGGVVTLTGEVRDFMEARYAWDDAWETAGVRGVINHLTVRADLPSESMEMPQTSGEQQGGSRGRHR